MSKVDTKAKFAKYEEYIELGMYEEMLIQLKRDSKVIGEEDMLEQQKYINAFFVNIFSEKFFDRQVTNGSANLFYPVVLAQLESDPDFALAKKNIGRFLNTGVAMNIFDSLMLNGNTKAAEVLMPFISKDSADHAELYRSLSEKGMEREFKFLLENLNNIHFDNDRLLLLTLDMNPSFANYMIGKQNFDVNKVPTLNGEYSEYIYSFVYSTVLENANGHLKNLMINHLEKINMGNVEIPTYGRTNLISFIKRISPTYEQLKIMMAPEFAAKISTDDLYDFLLDMVSKEKINEFAGTDIFVDLFKHPNFRSKHSRLEQHYLYYEFLDYLKINVVNRSIIGEKDIAKDLLSVFHDYLQYSDVDNVPNTKQLQKLGAVIHVYMISSEAKGQKIPNGEILDALLMAARRMPEYINQPNPRGDYLLSMSQEGSVLNSLLKEMGAKAPGKVWSFMGVKPKEVTEIPSNIQYRFYQEIESNKKLSSNATYAEMIMELKKEKENLWKEMQNSTSVTIHPLIFEAYGEIFKTAIDLLSYLNQNENVSVDAYEDTFFITNSMNKYIRDSIDSYKTVVSAASRMSDKEGEIHAEKTVRDSCLNNLQKIKKQLEASTDRFYQSVADNGLQKMRVNEKVVSSHIGRMNGMESEAVSDIRRRISAQANIAAANEELRELGDRGRVLTQKEEDIFFEGSQPLPTDSNSAGRSRKKM